MVIFLTRQRQTKKKIISSLTQPSAATQPSMSDTCDNSSTTPVCKKQKTGSKPVKTVDVAIISQRYDTVSQRVLKLESKLAKDRALLAKYSVQIHPTEEE